MKLTWSRAAVLALEAIEVRLAERYSRDRAVTMISELVERVDRLETYPQLGRVVPDTGSGNCVSLSTHGIACSIGSSPGASRS